MLEWKFWGFVPAWVWAGSVGDVQCARDSNPEELSWEVMKGDARGWPEAGEMPGWCREGEPRLAAGQTPLRHSCESWASLVWLVQGWKMDGSDPPDQPAAPLGLSAVKALETQLSGLAWK